MPLFPVSPIQLPVNAQLSSIFQHSISWFFPNFWFGGRGVCKRSQKYWSRISLSLFFGGDESHRTFCFPQTDRFNTVLWRTDKIYSDTRIFSEHTLIFTKLQTWRSRRLTLLQSSIVLTNAISPQTFQNDCSTLYYTDVLCLSSFRSWNVSPWSLTCASRFLHTREIKAYRLCLFTIFSSRSMCTSVHPRPLPVQPFALPDHNPLPDIFYFTNKHKLFTLPLWNP